MADHKTIQDISDLMHTPLSRMHGHDELAQSLIAKYPYFLPARYIKAAQEHTNAPYSDELLTSMYAYKGNWLLFCDHINGVAKEQVSVPSAESEIQADITAITEEHVLHIADEEIEAEETTPEPGHEENIAQIQSEIQEEESPVAETIELELVKMHNEETKKADDLIMPVYTEDYFRQQGVNVSPEIPEYIPKLHMSEEIADDITEDDKEKALMVMMSFTEWLLHFRNKAEMHRSEQEDKKAVRTMWQKEKLAAAMEEENDEIPDNVFEMAVNSITSEDGLASESLAEIYTKQQKYDKAIEMYRKLSLRNPQKNTYFARKIEEVLKEKQL